MVFLFRESLFFQFVLTFQFFFCFLSLFYCLKFSAVRCFFSVFELYDFDREHSNLMFFHVVVFSRRKFVSFFFCLSRTLHYFNVFLFFVLSKDSFFDVFEEILSSIINVRKWDVCSKKLMMNKNN